MRKSIGKRFVSAVTAAFMTFMNLSGSPGMFSSSAAESDFQFNVSVYDYDGTTPVPLEAEEGQKFLVMAHLTDKTDKNAVKGWAIQPFELGGKSSASVTFTEFTKYDGDGSNPGAEKFKYDDSLYDVHVRMYTGNQEFNTYSEVNNASFDGRLSDTLDDYKPRVDFSDAHKFDFAWVKESVFYHVDFDSEVPLDIRAEDNLYLFIEAKHKNSTSYCLTPVVMSGTSATIGVQTAEQMLWQDMNEKKGDKYHGSDSESIESVKLLKANGSLNLNGVLNTHNYQELTSGSNYSGLTLDIESVKKDPDAPPKSTTYVNKIHFKKSAGVKKDYDYKSILGSALKYGITADRFEQDNHAQTNLAVNFYEYNGFVITSDLSAPTAGDFYIPWYVHYDDSTDPPKADKSMALTPEQDGLIFFENKSVQGMVLHADGPERLKDMNSRLDYVDVKTDMTSEQMSETVIEPAIAHMKTVSADLLTHPQNVTPDFAGNKVSVNCKSLDKDATIYLDGDAIVKAMGGNLKYDNFTIEKKENQS